MGSAKSSMVAVMGPRVRSPDISVLLSKAQILYYYNMKGPPAKGGRTGERKILQKNGKEVRPSSRYPI